MNTPMNKYLIFCLFTLSCLASLPGCAPLLASQDPDVEVPAHFLRPGTETQNAAEMAWKQFFDDPQLVMLIDTALVRNQEVKMALQDINVANNEITARAGEYMPSIRLQAETDLGKVAQAYLRTRKEDFKTDFQTESESEGEVEAESTETPQPLPTFKVGAFLSWELDAWRKLRNAKDAAVYEYMASVEGRKFLITQLVAEIANSYYELMALDNKLANLEESVRIQRNVLEIIRQLKASARSNELAVKRFEAEVQKNQSLIYTVRQEIVETENKLNFLVGRAPQKIARNSAQFSDFKLKAVASGLPSDLLYNRSDIKKAEHELAATRLDVEVARARFYPSFGMNAGVGYQAFNPVYFVSVPQDLTYSLSLDMSMPLLNKNAIRAEYQNANAHQIQAAYEYERTILNAYREVSDQLAKLENLDKNYQLKHQQVDSLNRSIEVAQKLFQFARADYMEVLLTQREAIEARNELIETRQAQMGAMVDLYQALGGGWQDEAVVDKPAY